MVSLAAASSSRAQNAVTNDLDADPAARAPAARPQATLPPVPSSPAPGAKTAPPAPTAPSTIVAAPATFDAVAKLADAWAQWRDAEAKSDHNRSRRALLEFDEALLDAGIPGITNGHQARAYATALVRAAGRAHEAGRDTDANELMDVARHAAPNASTMALLAAQLAWRSNDGAALWRATTDVIASLGRDPWLMSSTASMLTMLAMGFIVLLLAAWVLLVCVPKLKHLGYDLWLSLPSGALPWQLTLLVVLVAAAPWLLGAGVVYSLLVAASLAYVYLSKASRVFMFVLVVLMLPLPFVMQVFARLHALPGSRAALSTDALFEYDAHEQRAWLASQSSLSPSDELVLALDQKRHGDLSGARDRVRAAIKASPEDPYLQANHGVLAALLGDYDVAEVAMTSALVPLADDAEALRVANYNLRTMQQRRGKAATETTTDDDLRRATFAAGKDVPAPGRAYVDVLPSPLTVVRSAVLGDVIPPAGSAVEQTTAGVLLGGLTGVMAALVLALFLVLWVVLSVVSARLRPAFSCSRCHGSATRRIDEKGIPPGVCAACFHTFIARPSRVSPDARQRKERALQRGRFVRSRGTVLLALVCPGAGHLYAGNLKTGLGLLCSALACVVAGVMMAQGFSLWGSPRLPGDGTLSMLWLLALAPLVLVWLLSLRGAFDLASDAVDGK
jgi:uncharacterized protein YjiS (DUF1127 family)